ncbi:MAG: DEAD/DEAH box helicase [Candidatus Poseidoniaceae archaeon]|jgi:helicase|nr:DEAD/DEAH box helicase [Candidatus Poseidoniaceae archaeon]
MAGAERRLRALDLPVNVVDFVEDKWGIKELHPPQADAMPSIISGKNTMVCIPTASGKSLVAFLGIARKLLIDEIGSRAIYIVPLKALASEKRDELTELGDAIGLKVGLGIGDSPGESRRIDDCDILVCTSEKLDSLMRSKPDLISKVSIIVADEFHLLNDSHRGPTMEINLTRLRHLRPDAQIITLSATVGNSQDLADWLDSDLILSEWRPVSLEYSTLAELNLEPRAIQKNELTSDSSLLNPPRTLDGPKSHAAWAVLQDSYSEKGQVLIFVSTRRSAQSEATKLGKRMFKLLSKASPEEIDKLNQLSDNLSRVSNSSMGDSLCQAIKGGVAFHHAGLQYQQRKIIEQAFKDGLIHCLCATPTLASGVNLPARRVLVRDLKRFDDGMSRYLSVMEVRQMLGRAGRPRYDTKGEAWLYCKGSDRLDLADQISERYIHGPIEDINSKLASEPAMRFHLLSSIATGGLITRSSIGDFFDSTFLGKTQTSSYLQETIDRMLRWLVDKRFIRRKIVGDAEKETWDDETPDWVQVAKATSGVVMTSGRKKTEPSEVTFGFHRASEISYTYEELYEASNTEYESTPMGERISQLYIDPLSADVMIQGLRRAVRRFVRKDLPVTEFGLCHLISATPDFIPFWAKSSELAFGSPLRQKSALVDDELLIESPIDERALGLVKSAWCTELWYNEIELREIEKQIGVTPGDIHSRVDLMSWLLLAAREVLLRDDVFADEHLVHVANLAAMIDVVRLRVRSGCKEDLLQLVQVRNIGRSRARELSKMGIRTPADLLKMTNRDLDKLKSKRGWGPKLVERIMESVSKLSNSNQDKPKRSDDEPLEGERQH